MCYTGESREPILRSVMLRLNVCDHYATMYAARHGSYLGTPWTLPLLSMETCAPSPARHGVIEFLRLCNNMNHPIETCLAPLVYSGQIPR